MLGSRGWKDRATVEAGLQKAACELPQSELVQLVHGGDHSGACFFAEMIWNEWHEKHPYLFEASETHPLARFGGSDFQRDNHIVHQGIDLVVTFFVSPTEKDVYGHLSQSFAYPARNARKLGIPVLDFGEVTE